jgi:hypothetical protein
LEVTFCQWRIAIGGLVGASSRGSAIILAFQKRLVQG